MKSKTPCFTSVPGARETHNTYMWNECMKKMAWFPSIEAEQSVLVLGPWLEACGLVALQHQATGPTRHLRS